MAHSSFKGLGTAFFPVISNPTQMSQRQRGRSSTSLNVQTKKKKSPDQSLFFD